MIQVKTFLIYAQVITMRRNGGAVFVILHFLFSFPHYETPNIASNFWEKCAFPRQKDSSRKRNFYANVTIAIRACLLIRPSSII